MHHTDEEGEALPIMVPQESKGKAKGKGDQGKGKSDDATRGNNQAGTTSAETKLGSNAAVGGSPKPTPPTPKEDPTPKPKVSASKIKEAIALRSAFLKVKAAADALVSRVEKDKSQEWKWCDTPELIGVLKSELDEFESGLSAPMRDCVLGGDPKVLASQLGNDKVEAEWAQFVQKRACVASIQRQHKMLVAMHSKRVAK